MLIETSKVTLEKGKHVKKGFKEKGRKIEEGMPSWFGLTLALILGGFICLTIKAPWVTCNARNK